MTSPTRSYEVRTYGCQMNVHDSERLSGLLEDAGYIAGAPGESDVVVFNTCAVRENADNKLYGNLGMLLAKKKENPSLQIAVGGCLAQKDRDTIIKKAPWVDVVFGTHNIGSLPALLERSRHNSEAAIEIVESLETFPSNLPVKRDSTYAAWVSISVGLNFARTMVPVCLRMELPLDAAGKSPLSRNSVAATRWCPPSKQNNLGCRSKFAGFGNYSW